MLGDIQEGNGRQKLARKILASAREVYQNDSVAEDKFPDLKRMVEKRLSGFKLPTRDLDGKVALSHDEEELGLIREMILSDD